MSELVGEVVEVVDGKKHVKLYCGPGLTKQSFKDDVDINKIIARFEKTGMVESVNSKEPFYGDVSGVVGYQEALEKVREAEDLFMKMSPQIRARFGNDPEQMIAFLNDESNLKEAIDLGMVTKRPEVAPGEAETPK